LGEPIRTRISLGVYGKGKTRILAGRLFTKPAVAKSFVRGRLRLQLQRKAGAKWRKLAARAGASARGKLLTSRKLKPGKYRVVVEFPGYKSFRPARAARRFTVR
jgi:hypothetical protein